MRKSLLWPIKLNGWFVILACLLCSGCQSMQTIDALKRVEIEVEISGEVHTPGMYTMPKESNIQELLVLAGGAREDADLSGLNLHQRLHHHDVLVIEAKKELVKISINTANQSQLETLPGIGPKSAQAILQYRETKGLFQSIEGLLEIKGIGSKKLAKLREFVKL